jgi:predicted DsbA family dithiol-disulfide isomerase
VHDCDVAIPTREISMRCARLLLCTAAAIFTLATAAALPDARDEWGRTPLIVALQRKDAAAFEALLAAGADIKATDAWGRTPLLVAMQIRDNAAAKKLIERGSDVDAANRNDITPLISAAQTNNVELARVLLDAGAATSRRDNMGLTALDWAERRKLEAMAALLAGRGALRGSASASGAPRSAEPAPLAAFPPRHEFGRAFIGNPAAAVTIYEYTDLQCPYCAHGAKVLKEVLARYEGQVRVVVKHLPLPAIHPQAMRAAEYFEAIALQDAAKAFAFHDRVFAGQPRLAAGEDFLRATALEVGADGERLARDLAAPQVQARIAADLAESKAYQFDGVPAFVVDGRVLKGAQPAERFFELVEAALARRG